MTTLVITPNVKRKTIKCEGRIAAGEHVLVRVETFDDKVGEGKSLRLRAVGQNGETLAVFPPQVKDDDPPRPQEELAWQVDDGDATCVFDFNTAPAEKFLRCGGECLFVLDDVVNHTLYGNGFCTVAPWSKVAGLDAPVDLDGYKDLGDRVADVENGIAYVGEMATDAVSEASDAKRTAEEAARTAETARTDAANAGNAAISAASSASAAQSSAASALSAAGAAAASASASSASAKSASDKFDELSDVAKSGDYSDLKNKPDIPSIAGLATIEGLSAEENRAKGVERDIIVRLEKTPTLDEGGKVPSSQLPSYVDDVLEYGDRTRFPMFGEGGKIYVDMSTNHLYRWTGTVYVQIPAGLALGETAASAYPGNKGLENAQGIANLRTSKQAALNAQQLAAVNSGITSAKVSSMVTRDDVQPRGDGTEVIAVIGGKEIKAPAGAVVSVNHKTGAVVLDGEDIDVGAGDSRSVTKAFNDLESSFVAHAGNSENPHGVTVDQIGAQKKLTAGSNITITADGVISASGGEGTVKSVANVQPTPDGNVPLTAKDVSAVGVDGGEVNQLVVHGLDDSEPGSLVVNGKVVPGGFVFVGNGVQIRSYGGEDSITKGGKEVATEEQVGEVSEKVDALKDAVNENNRLLVDDTTAAIQTRESEDAEWSDEIRLDKGYDALTGDAMVKLDKSVQTVTVSGSNLEIVLPDAVSGTVRDFCVYANNSGDADTAMTFPAGTYYGDNPNGAVAKAGKVTGIYLSEIPNGVWTLCIRELEQHEVTA